MSKRLDQLSKDFSALSHDGKKQKMCEILEFIKDKMDIANAMTTFIKGSQNVSDDFLERNYMMIMQLAIEGNEKNMNEKEKTRLEKIASIRKDEEIDKDNADELLQNL